MMSRTPKKLRKVLTIGASTVFFGSSLYYFHKNDYNYNNIGIIRFARAGIMVSETVIDYKWALFGLDPESEKYKIALCDAHRRGADRLLSLAKSNGGIFIKAGQQLATLQYLLPIEYTSTLSVLHSKAPESKLSDLEKVFQESLGKTIDEVFTDFTTQPYGVASLAQVYSARLKSNGEKVAVKIQHPFVKSRTVIDLATIEFFMRIVHMAFSDLNLMWLVHELEGNLMNELNFLQEAKNADKARKIYGNLPWLKIPKIHYEYTSDQVLTMEFCEGALISDLEYFDKNKINKHDVCRKVGELYSRMIFVDGYIHCDPHPGNILVHKNEKSGEVKIILLDHGLYKTLEPEFKVDYSKLWLALLKPDLPEIQRICTKMGLGEFYEHFVFMVTARSWKTIRKGLDRSVMDEDERKEIREFAAKVLPQIYKVASRMPHIMPLILKSNNLLRGIEYRLGTFNRQDAFIAMSKGCIRTVYESALKEQEKLTKRLSLYSQLYWALFKVYAMEWFLYIADLGRKMYLIK